MPRFSLPQLEYSLSHPHPRNHWFFIGTVIVFVLAVPVLVIVNIVTLGYELVPSLQSQFQPNDTLAGWWASTRLPHLLRSSTPPCQPVDLGRGDKFRLTASLFDYTVMSTWDTTKNTSTSKVQNQQRVEYRGQSFASCSVNGVQFDYSLVEGTQTVTVGVICPGTPDYPIYVSMETEMVFAWLISKDLVGQYYGSGLDVQDIADADPNDYRTLAFAVLEAISSDSLAVMHRQHLPTPILSISSYYEILWIDGIINANATDNSLTWLNGTNAQWPTEANIYLDAIFNLVNVAAHTVNLDLGSAGPENIYKNRAVVNKTLSHNTPPPGIPSADWAQYSMSFYYGGIIPPYQSWADMLRAGQKIVLGGVTGLPNDSSMVTSYLCPSYQLKPTKSLLTSIFVGSATMFLSVWAAWMFVTTFIARRIQSPCLDCRCPKCIHKCRLDCYCPKCKPKPVPQDQNGVDTSSPVQSSSNGRASGDTKETVDPEKGRPQRSSYGGSFLKRLSYRSSSTTGGT